MKSRHANIWSRLFSKYLAYFLLGASFGAAVMLLMLGQQINHLYASLDQRNTEVSSLKDQVESLEKELSDEQRVEVIKEIDLNLLERKDQRLSKVTRESVNTQVYDWLKQMNIIGEPVHRYEELPQFFRETINQHQVKVGDKPYRLEFDAVAIGARVRIWYYVKEATDDVAAW